MYSKTNVTCFLSFVDMCVSFWKRPEGQEITNRERFSKERERECIGIKGYKGIMEQKG